MGESGSKPPFFYCDHCGKVLLREYALVMHKRNEHPTVKETLECQYCGKDFKNAKFLKNHEEKHRNGMIDGDSHFCHICSKSFSTRLNLNRHIKGTHEKIKDHQCPECGKKFVDRYFFFFVFFASVICACKNFSPAHSGIFSSFLSHAAE